MAQGRARTRKEWDGGAPLSRRRLILPIVGLALLFFSSLEPGLSVTHETGFMLIGQVFPAECPVPGWLDQEPGFYYTIIPTDTDRLALTEEESQRYVRQYFPRTKKELFSKYQFMVMPDTHLRPFTGKQILWLKEGFEEHGISDFVTLGADLTGDYEGEWLASPLQEDLPTSMRGQSRLSGSFTVEILVDDPPILSMFKQFGIENSPGSSPFSKNTPRHGSTTWGMAKFTSGGIRSPWLISWKLGSKGGHIWAASDDLDHRWWNPSGMRSASTNPYAGDVFLNIIYYSTGRVLPTDITLVHELRTRFDVFKTSRGMITGVVELADSFGANTVKVEKELAEVEKIYRQARDEYAAGDYDGCSESLDRAMEESKRVLDLAFRVKKTAMFHIYLIEWLVTTGTLLLSGSVLYSLMVRRRVYREVETTRLSHWEE